MFDRKLRLTCPEPDHATHVPASCETRVQPQRPINQRDHRADVLAKVGQRIGSIHQHSRIVIGDVHRPPGELLRPQIIHRAICAALFPNQPHAADRGPGERGAITRVAVR